MSEDTIDARLKAREDFFRLLSHEIRTPLNGVLGMMSLLERTQLSPDQKAYLATAQESGAHLMSLVNDFLDYARIDSGKIEFEMTRVYLEPLLQSVAELLAPRAFANGIEIIWQLESDLDYIICDEGRLRQILFNLAGNALKFTEIGGVSVKVSLDESDHIRFVIKDTGPGIPVEARERIFEAFGQVDPSHASKYGGAGLGLVVVKKLVAAMDGVLDLKSEVGQGSEFIICFKTPYGLRHSAASPKSADKIALFSDNQVLINGARTHLMAFDRDIKPIKSLDYIRQDLVVLADRSFISDGPRPAPNAKSLILLAPEQRDEIEAWRNFGWAGYLIKPLRRQSLLARLDALAGMDVTTDDQGDEDERALAHATFNKSVLLVEDNPVNALLAQVLLQREGCHVERAASGEDALALLQSYKYDMIFMDLGLPGQDGLTISRLIRQFDLRTPIIALTANAYEEDRKACLSAGMNDFLTKPINPLAMKACLNSYFGSAEVAA